MVNKVTKPTVDKKEEKYRKENFPDVNKIVDKKVLCTSCNISVKPLLLKGKPKVHPFMDTLLCDKCFAFFGDGDFSTDEDGSDKYCRWCGQGGTLYLCSKCTAGFCKRCIKRNLPRAVWKEVEDDDWKCLCCNVAPLYELRAQAWASLEYVKANTKEKNDSTSRKRKNKADSDTESAKKAKKSDDENEEEEETTRAPRKTSRDKSSKKKTQEHADGSDEDDKSKKMKTRQLKVAKTKLTSFFTEGAKLMDLTKRKAEDFKRKVSKIKDVDAVLAMADHVTNMMMSVETHSVELRENVTDFKTKFQQAIQELQNGLEEKKASEENGDLDTSEKKDEANDSEKEEDADKKDSTDVEMKETTENDKGDESTTKEDDAEDSKSDQDEKTKSDKESDLDKTVDPAESSEGVKESHSKDDFEEAEDPKSESN